LRPCCLKRGLGSRPVALSLVFCWPDCRCRLVAFFW
jgi:hypothetical protein